MLSLSTSKTAEKGDSLKWFLMYHSSSVGDSLSIDHNRLHVQCPMQLICCMYHVASSATCPKLISIYCRIVAQLQLQLQLQLWL